jgi:hypothetical protein
MLLYSHSQVIKALKPIMDLWGILFKALGPSECFGLKGFTSKWLLRVVGLPGILGLLCLLYYLYDKRTNTDKAQPKTNLISHLFFAVFFCYPTICIVSFAAFICRQLTPDISVLDQDDSVVCEDASHRVLQTISGVIIVVVAFGLPVLFAFVLIRSARNYTRDFAGPHEAIVQRVASDMDVTPNTAAWVVRDITIGRDYSFLMDAYSPDYLYWEALDMLRKLALVGLVLCVGRGSIAQLSVALVLSFAFFALQMKTWPYKINTDNLFRAATEAHVFIVIATALIMKNDLRWEPLGIDAYDYILFGSFILLVPVAFVLAVSSKLKHIQHVLNIKRNVDSTIEQRQMAFDLQVVGLAEHSHRRALKRYFEGWFVHKEYAVFLSHFKMEAAAEARVLKTELVRSLRTAEEQIFLDADNLTDLRELLTHVENSDAVVLLYTQALLSRPWCLLELQAAVTHKVPIILLRVANAFAGDPEQIESILNDLPAYLATANPAADETLRALDCDVAELGAVLKKALVGRDVLSFDPHQSSAMLQAQIAQLAKALVTEACPQNESLLIDFASNAEAEHWPVKRTYAVYIVHEEQVEAVAAAAEGVKQWLLDHNDLEPAQIAVQAQRSRGRGAHEVTSADLADVAEEADCVLLLQSANVLSEPRCLALLHGAAVNAVPICCTVLTKTKDEHDALLYNFETAKPMLQDLPAHLGPAAAAALESVTRTSSTLNIGLALAELLPNIISKPLGLEADAGIIGAQMAEIERTLRRAELGTAAAAAVAAKRVLGGGAADVETPTAQP